MRKSKFSEPNPYFKGVKPTRLTATEVIADPVGKCRSGWEAWRKKCQKEDEEGRLLLSAIAGKLETILSEKDFEVRKLINGS